jgi:hypothetical protein
MAGGEDDEKMGILISEIGGSENNKFAEFKPFYLQKIACSFEHLGCSIDKNQWKQIDSSNSDEKS